jgi:hypothetical protein
MAPKRSTDGWQIVTHVSIGPVRFGMSRAEVAKAIGSKADSKKGAEPKPFDTFKVGLSVVHVYYTAEERCEYVEVMGGGLGGPELDGRGFLNRPYDRALAWAKERDPNVVSDGAGLRSDRLGLGLFVETGEEKIKGIGAAAPDYWNK